MLFFDQYDNPVNEWIPKMTAAILEAEDVNVIMVDWVGGAKTGIWYYNQAASNVRVVGVEIKKLITHLCVSFLLFLLIVLIIILIVNLYF